MSANITGKMIVYKNEYGYSTNISSKNQNGEYENMYVSVQLPKGKDIQNKTMIEVSKGFLSFYKTKEGLPKIKIIVMEYNLDENVKCQQEERQAIQNEDFYSYNNNELPF